MPQLEIGDSISYVLLPKDLPTDPTREYHGVIIALSSDRTRIHVRLTEPLYEGLDEWIEARQIITGGEEKGEENHFTTMDFSGQ